MVLSPLFTVDRFNFHLGTSESVRRSASRSRWPREEEWRPSAQTMNTFAVFDGVATYVSCDTTTGSRLLARPLPTGLAMIGGVAFRPDGKVLATGQGHHTAESCTVHLWEADTGLPIGRPLMQPSLVNSLSFSPDGTTLATLDDRGANRLWDSTTGERMGEPFGKQVEHSHALNFSSIVPNISRLIAPRIRTFSS